jgi:hypothetical protein
MQYYKNIPKTLCHVSYNHWPVTNQPIIKSMVTFADIVSNVKAIVPNAMDLGIGVATGIWFYTVVKVPWDIYFTSRDVRLDAEDSVKLGLHVDPKSVRDAKSFETTSLIAYIPFLLIIVPLQVMLSLPGQFMVLHTSVMKLSCVNVPHFFF